MSLKIDASDTTNEKITTHKSLEIFQVYLLMEVWHDISFENLKI